MSRTRSLVAMLLVLLAACGQAPDTAGTSATTSTSTSTTTTTTAASSPGPALFGQALRLLFEERSTFGPGHRFDTVLVQTRTDPLAGTGMEDGSTRLLTDAERTAIELAIEDLSDDIRWIDDPAEWRTADLMPLVPDSAIVGVGELQYDDAGALIPVSLWCGGLCGTWFTWRAEIVGGEWEITGTEGPVMIS